MYAQRYFVRPVQHPGFAGVARNQEPAVAQWSPAVDIREEAERFVILADVPGVDPTSIEVSMEKNVLSLSGKRGQSELVDGSRLARAERGQGSFERRFVLPENVDAEAITALGRHGVLELTIPKKAAAVPRRIEVGTAH